METLALALFIVSLSPPSNLEQLAFRVEVAEAIARVTPDDHEQRLLASIARWESAYRPEIAKCSITGDGGLAKSLFQVHPRSGIESRDLCESLEGSARIALSRVRESRLKCGDLSGYVSGKCGVGLQAAKNRWVD